MQSTIRTILVVAILLMAFAAVPALAGDDHPVTYDTSDHPEEAPHFEEGQWYMVTAADGISVYREGYVRRVGLDVQEADLPTGAVFQVTANSNPANTYAIARYLNEDAVYVLETDIASVRPISDPTPRVEWQDRLISSAQLTSATATAQG